MKKVNIKDVAKHSNVSPITVSRVVNKNYKFVSKKTRLKIEKIIDELGYKPNLIARGLKKQSMNTVGVVLPDSSNPSWAKIIKGITDEIKLRGYYSIISNSNGNISTEINSIIDLSSMMIAGIILMSSSTDDEDIDFLSKITKPLVIVDRLIPGLNTDSIIFNNFKGGYDAGKLLIDNGFKKIIILNGNSSLNTFQDRYRGWKDAMEENNLFNEKNVFWGSFSKESDYEFIEYGYGLMKESFDKVGKMEAVFATSDLIAIGAQKAIEEKGYSVPEDISIIGFDDIFASRFMKPALTTINAPLYKLGKGAADLIMQGISNPKKTKHQKIVLDCELIIRDSVKLKKNH